MVINILGGHNTTFHSSPQTLLKKSFTFFKTLQDFFMVNAQYAQVFIQSAITSGSNFNQNLSMPTDFTKLSSTNFNEISSAGFKLFHVFRQKNRAILTGTWQVCEFVYRQTVQQF